MEILVSERLTYLHVLSIKKHFLQPENEASSFSKSTKVQSILVVQSVRQKGFNTTGTPSKCYQSH